MIPKIIHYCWFGRGDVPKLMKKCIKSWKKFCPDWEIILWNEDNFDVNSTLWTKQAYEAKKYAFVADYVRLYALYNYGGVYLDTDQQLIKKIDCFTEHKAFMGFIGDTDISMGIIGAEKAHPFISNLLSYYDNRKFILNDGTLDIVPNTDIATDLLKSYGFVPKNSRQTVMDIEIYPKIVFCPYNVYEYKHYSKKETYALHLWAMTWRTDKAKKDFARVRRHQTKWYRFFERLRYLPNRIVRKIFGDKSIDKLKNKTKK